MIFEYDDDKSAANKLKHNIDFDEVQQLWNDEFAFEIPSNQSNEDRFLVFGKINGKNWTAIITYRDTNIRIISARRSRKIEVDLYERVRNR